MNAFARYAAVLNILLPLAMAQTEISVVAYEGLTCDPSLLWFAVSGNIPEPCHTYGAGSSIFTMDDGHYRYDEYSSTNCEVENNIIWVSVECLDTCHYDVSANASWLFTREEITPCDWSYGVPCYPSNVAGVDPTAGDPNCTGDETTNENGGDDELDENPCTHPGCDLLMNENNAVDNSLPYLQRLLFGFTLLLWAMNEFMT